MDSFFMVRFFFFLKLFLLNTYFPPFSSLFDVLRNEARVMEGLHRLGIEGLSLHNVLKLNIQPSEADYAVDIRSPAISVGIPFECPRAFWADILLRLSHLSFVRGKLFLSSPLLASNSDVQQLLIWDHVYIIVSLFF